MNTNLSNPIQKNKSQPSESNRHNIYTKITAQIIENLEKGVRPWVKPWNAKNAVGRISRPLRHNGEPYTGVNIISLWCAANELGFSNPTWITFKQAQELGGHVRKGEKGSPVVYASAFTRSETDETTGKNVEREIPFLKVYTVFNVEQVDGLPAHYYEVNKSNSNPLERIAHVEAFFSATKAEIIHSGNKAFYCTATDSIVMPQLDDFRDVNKYYSVLSHEITHWTRHKSRLDRDFKSKRFDNEDRAMEELVAELGSAFLCADLGIMLEGREDHSAYIANWLKVLKNDNRAIFTASAHAQRAADFIHRLQPVFIEKAA